MIYDDILPHYLAIGVTWERFMDSCPIELEPYDKAHKKQLIEQDMLQHAWWGHYGLSAVSVAVEHCLSKNPKSKYIDKPILKEVEEQNKPISKEELRKQRELFIAKLEVMKANFELSHPKQNS